MKSYRKPKIGEILQRTDDNKLFKVVKDHGYLIELESLAEPERHFRIGPDIIYRYPNVDVSE